jgi:hypothetical protein
MNSIQTAIPKEKVFELCKVIRNKHQESKWPFGIGKMQCWGCWKFGMKNEEEGNTSNICALNHPENRGCRQINVLYDQLY